VRDSRDFSGKRAAGGDSTRSALTFSIPRLYTRFVIPGDEWPNSFDASSSEAHFVAHIARRS